MAQKQKVTINWDEHAHRCGMAAFDALQKSMADGVGDTPSAMPLLEGQKIYVIAALVRLCRETMAWIPLIQDKVDIKTATVMEHPAVGKFGNCFDCGAPFHHPSAGIPWKIGLDTVKDLCCTCNDRRLEARRA